jgi:hypothetical protein
MTSARLDQFPRGRYWIPKRYLRIGDKPYPRQAPAFCVAGHGGFSAFPQFDTDQFMHSHSHLKKLVSIIGTALALWGSPLGASSPAPNPETKPSPTPPCTTPEFRQFDFWLGHWKVTNPKGKQVGTSEISRAAEGCAIREQWTSASGTSGMSINYYDSNDHKWHQDWVGGDGTILHLHGGLEGKAIVLSGESKTNGKTILNRITWTPLPEGKVKQEWDVSSDEGRTWKTVFTGIYEKATASAAGYRGPNSSP